MKIRMLSLIVFCVAVMGLLCTAAFAGTKRIVIFQPSLNRSGGFPVNERSIAKEMGWEVQVPSLKKWAAMTTADFQSFDAIIISDDGCDGSALTLQVLNGTKWTWSPAVHGNMVINNQDPVYHAAQGDGPAAPKIREITNMLNYVTSGGATGLYIGGLGCYYDAFTVNWLSPFGTVSINTGNDDPVTIVQPSSPLVAGLTNAALSGWGSSFHAQFTAFPSFLTPILNGTDPDFGTLPIMVAGKRP